MDLVQINNGQAVTSSLQVAEYFGKKHQHVMEKVRALLAEIPSDWGVSNFRQSSYFNLQGKEQPCYEMTKDFAEPNFRLCFKINQLQNGKPQAYYERKVWVCS